GGTAYAARADLATKKEQILIAEKVLKVQGEGVWPRCGPAANLGADPYPDPVPPVSKVTGLASGTVATGTITLTASVTDAVGAPTQATFYVDGRAVGTDTGAGPAYSVSLDTTTLTDGAHTVTVRAVNDAGQTGPLSEGVSFLTANRATTARTTGDFNGDGKDDVAVLYDNGQGTDGLYRTAVWTFTSTGTGFGQPVKKWDNVSTGFGSWNWDRSKVTAADFNGDGKADVGILYDNGQAEDGRNKSALWALTSTGSDFTNPSRKWDSGTGSWNAAASKVTAGDGKADVGVLYNYGRQTAGTNRTGLWKFTGTGTGFADPAMTWDSASSGSWNWISSDLA
ncbi:Ig-like domain-containing protein, partial [Streptomyces wedmorensis]